MLSTDISFNLYNSISERNFQLHLHWQLAEAKWFDQEKTSGSWLNQNCEYEYQGSWLQKFDSVPPEVYREDIKAELGKMIV